MSSTQNDSRRMVTDETTTPDVSGLSRRKFLGGVGGAAAVAAAAGMVGLEPLAHAAVGQDLEDFSAEASTDGPGRQRRNGSWQVRKDGADYWVKVKPTSHATNGDEARYPNKIGNYSKGLPHNAFGEVDPAAYDSLLQRRAPRATRTTSSDVIMGGTNKLTTPQGGLAFDLEGVDAMAVTVPPPPAIAQRRGGGRGRRASTGCRCCATSTSSTTDQQPGRRGGRHRPQQASGPSSAVRARAAG